MKTPAIVLALSAAMALASTASAQEAVEIRFTFEVGAETGAVMAALFDSADGYDGNRPVRGARVDVAAGEREAVFRGLPPGEYALRAFHDVNGDGELNTNPFGVPVEPFAFSNNARGNMGPARWDAVRFEARGPVVQTLSIR